MSGELPEDLGNEAGVRRVQRELRATRPWGSGATTTRRPVVKRYGGRLPTSGSDVDLMRVAAQEPWECECEATHRYHVKRCRRCGGERPW